MESHPILSRRERQIMDIVYARGTASVNEVLSDIPDPPSRASVRTLLRILEEKGQLRHRKVGREFVYRPVRARRRAGQSALRRVLSTFFDGSMEEALAAHFADPGTDLTDDDIRRLRKVIREAKGKGKKSC